MIRILLTSAVCILLVTVATAQNDSARTRVYRVNPVIELPAAAVGIALSNMGFRQLEKTAHLSASDVFKLDPGSVNAFDRPSVYLDPAKFENADMRSDFFLNISLVSPLLLAFDRHIRKDWVDLLSLYLATHAVDNAMYFAGAFSVRRPRPLVYNPNVDIAAKTGDGKSNSFFSGHTSFSSAATFFVAKVYTDYHHIRGWKRILAYTIASIPPALVGYYRLEAGKHFRTDVMLGFAVGAASGIVVPELHKNRKRAVSVLPYYSGNTGGLAALIKL